MTAIVSSVIACRTRQADGRHYVREIHTDEKGNEFIYDYIADEGADIPALLKAHVSMMLRRADELQAAQGMTGGGSLKVQDDSQSFIFSPDVVAE